MSQSATEFHEEHKKRYKQKLKAVSNRISQFAWLRLITFILIFVPLIIWGWNGWLTVIPSVIFAAVFIFLIKKNILYERQKKNYELLVKLSSDELLALNNQFNHFENGTYFLNPSHFNSYDLDLFGEGSVFQFLNRTSTQSGSRTLAGWLQNPFLDKSEIERRQGAVQELSGKPEWRLKFLAQGHMFQESTAQSEEIRNWSDKELHLKRPSTTRWLLTIIPALTIAAGVYTIMGGSNLWVVIMILIQSGLHYFSRKQVSLYYDFFGKKTDLLEKYMHLVRFIEKEEFTSPFMKDLQKSVLKPESASHIFGQLKKITNQFDYRQNLIINFLFNALLMWDIRCTYKLWKWHRRNRKKLITWMDAISVTDGLISLGNMAFNHPEFNYPSIHEGGFMLDAKQMGHPLIPAAKRVDNDFHITGWRKVLIITGANMAGKSTFLRTVGVNLILGRTGAPVCAGELTYTPVKIYTNMRTTDSLLKDESYFYAELKRLKTVLDKLREGERIFVILDEMLKGTNSVDKFNGSKQLIKKLLELKAVALIATHDLKISEMENEYPQMVYNKCFEIKLENEEMIFDYLLKDGVTKTMNATFLMKKMGII